MSSAGPGGLYWRWRRGLDRAWSCSTWATSRRPTSPPWRPWPDWCSPHAGWGSRAGSGARRPRSTSSWSSWASATRSGTRRSSGSSARRLLHEGGQLLLVGGGQLRQRVRGRPHGALVQVGRILEAERGVPRFELLGALEETDDLAVLGIARHPLPGPRPEVRCGLLDDRVDPGGHGPVRSLHRLDGGDDVGFSRCPVLAHALLGLPLPDEALHRGSFIGAEHA